MPESLALALFMISELLRTILTCDQIMLHKRTEGPPLREGVQSPTEFSGTLNLCSHWCVDKLGCYAVSWETGSCLKVGPLPIVGAVVSTAVYIVPKNNVPPGKQSPCCLLPSSDKGRLWYFGI